MMLCVIDEKLVGNIAKYVRVVELRRGTFHMRVSFFLARPCKQLLKGPKMEMDLCGRKSHRPWIKSSETQS